jgi:hypothetical protein
VLTALKNTHKKVITTERHELAGPGVSRHDQTVRQIGLLGCGEDSPATRAKATSPNMIGPLLGTGVRDTGGGATVDTYHVNILTLSRRES